MGRKPRAPAELKARAHYRDALNVAIDMRFRPEIALTRYQMADLMLARYPDERDEAQRAMLGYYPNPEYSEG